MCMENCLYFLEKVKFWDIFADIFISEKQKFDRADKNKVIFSRIVHNITYHNPEAKSSSNRKQNQKKIFGLQSFLDFAHFWPIKFLIFGINMIFWAEMGQII